MKPKQKIMASAAGIVSLTGTVIAHGGEETTSTMMGGAWMHDAGHMTPMWGFGWLIPLLGIAIWALLILGIIYLFQQLTGNQEESSE